MKRRILSMLCVLGLLLSMITMPAYATDQSTDSAAAVCNGENFSSLQAAVDDYSFGTIVLQKDAQNVNITRDVHLDTNGHNVAGVTVESGATLYISDSQTDDYTVADGIYGSVTGATGNVQAAQGYVAITEGEAVSYHKADLTLTSMTLRPAVAGVYYNSAFAADEVVAANVESYGVALSVVAEPTAENLTSLCGYSVFRNFEAGEKSGTLLTGIMTEENTDFANSRNAAMAVYGRAYIKTADGYVFGATASRDLKTQVEAIDTVFGSLNAAQKSAIAQLYKTYETVMSTWNVPNIAEAAKGLLTGDVEITVPVDADDGVVANTVTVEQDGVSITIPFGTLVTSDQLTLTVTRLEDSESDIEAGEGKTLMPFDVHVDGIAADNTVPLTVALGKVMPENLNMGNYTVYHVEENGTNPMGLVANDEEFTAHNQFKYTLDGELTLNMASFSEVAVVSDNDNAWNGGVDYSWYEAAATELTIRNADQLAGLNKIVSGDAGELQQDDFSGKTVKLLSDLNFAGSIWYPIGYWAPGEGNNSAGESQWYTYGGGFSGIFDGNGNTVSNISQNTWALNGNYDYGYWDEAMGLFGYVLNGTVKNLTVENFQSDGEFTPTGCVTAYACNSTFENIALVDCNPRVYNTGNGGIVGIGGNSGDPDTYNLTFNNITIDNSNKITALWGSWDVACGGLIGMFRGDGHVYMNNCHVAAQIDVYNDVCGNYQYYWYRYSGMLVGTNKNMTTDGAGYTVPETDKFHAEDCTVHFGTWNDYYYCELVANSLASYTHDHQFSRLTQIASLSEIWDGEAWLKTGNYLLIDGDTKTCYHIVKDAEGNLKRHNHADAGEETVSGETVLKEDKQIVYLPFNQLFTGYGWGVKHIPIYDDGTPNPFSGVTILDREYADSVVKFDKLITDGKEYVTGKTVTLGTLFAAAEFEDEKLTIQQDKLQVTVSPATEGSTASGTYTANDTDWTKGKLTFSGYGQAKITITDYYFCIPTELTVYISINAEDVNDIAVEMDFTDADENGVVNAICPACIAVGDDGIKQWKPLPAITTKYTFTAGTHYHYYLDAEKDYTKNQSFYLISNSNTNVCLHLNEREIKSSSRTLINDNVGSTMNVMGTGLVAGGSGTVAMSGNYNINGLAIDTIGPVNLYGGTYSADENATGDYTSNPIVSARGTNSKCVVNMYDDVSIVRDAADAKGWCVYIGDNSTMNMYGGEISGGSAVEHKYYPELGAVGGNIVIKKRTHTNSTYTAKLIVYGGVISNDSNLPGGNIAVIGNDDEYGYANPKVSVTIRGDAQVLGGSMKAFVNNTTFSVRDNPVIDNLDLTSGHKLIVGALGKNMDIKITAALGATVSEELSDSQLACGKYFESTTAGYDVTVVDNVLKVVDDVCVHCDTANAEIEWKSLTQDTLGSLITQCSESSRNYYLPTGHYRMDSDVSRASQLFIGDFKSEDASTYTKLACDVALDLNNHKYFSSSADASSADSGNRAFYVINYGSRFSIMDTSAEKGGEIIGNYAASGATIFARTGTTVDIYGGTISWERDSYTAASGVVDVRGGVVNIYDGATLNGVRARAAGATIMGTVDGETNKDSVINIYGGTINGGTTTTNGGTIAISGGALNVYGGTINKGEATGKGNTIYCTTHNNGDKAEMNFMGGTIDGEIVIVSPETPVTVSGAPVITQLDLTYGVKLDVETLSEGASITVVADGVFTKELADATAVKKFFHPGEAEHHIFIKDSALAYKATSVYDVAVLMDFTTTEADGKVTAVCPVCGTEADWYPMPVVTESSYAFDQDAHHHYYLDPNVDYTQNTGYYGAGSNTQVCLNLNGQDIVSAKRAFWNEGSATVVNIMGDGSVTGNGQWVNQTAGTYRAAIDCTAALNLYGGTYESANEFPAIQMRSTTNANCVLGVYEGTVIRTDTYDCALEVLGISTINIYGGSVLDGSVRKGVDTATLTISGNPVIEKLDLSNGQTVTVGTMTDGASIAVLAPDNVAFTNTIEANAEAYTAYFQAYELKKGVDVQENALVITDVCPHCGVPLADIEWTLIEETGNYHEITESGHYKLAADITAGSENAIKLVTATATTGLDVVLDTSGFDITAASSRSFFIGSYDHFTVFDSVGGSVCTSNSTNDLLGGSGFTAYDHAVVNVYDITLNGSKNANGKGNCISVYGANTVVNIYSGTFNGTDCTTSGNHGGTVYNHGTLNIYGGTFNDADVIGAFGGCLYSDGSLYVQNAALNGDVYVAAGTVEVAGAAVIAELYLSEGMEVTVGELTDGASIAVATDTTSGVFTAGGNAQYRKYFSAVDSENCWVEANENGELTVKTRVLEAGFGRVSVTPDYEVKLAGGAATRMATECKDDLSVTCVALKEGGQIYLVCSMDFITANYNYVNPAKKAMSAATGVPVENIIMNATHTHSSVDIRSTGWENQARYLEDFCAWATEAAVMAVDDLSVATVSYGSTQAEKLTWVRHYQREDGTYTGANYGTSNSSPIVGHAYEADTEMQMIRFSRANKAQDVVLMNFGCHATNEQTKTVMSADFPYYFRKFVEEHDTVDESGNAIAGSKDVLCAYFMAAAGDQVHSSRIANEAIITDYKDHGEKLGRYAVALLNGGTMTASSTVGTSFATKTFTAERNCPTVEDYNKALEVKAVWDTLEGGRGSDEGKAAAVNAGFESVYQVSAIISNYEAYQENPQNSMEIKVMSIGDIGFIFAPYEMFAQQGMDIKTNSPFAMTFVVTCSSSHAGYLPSVKGWEMNSYESHVTHFVKGTAEVLATEFVDMLKTLKEN